MNQKLFIKKVKGEGRNECQGQGEGGKLGGELPFPARASRKEKKVRLIIRRSSSLERGRHMKQESYHRRGGVERRGEGRRSSREDILPSILKKRKKVPRMAGRKVGSWSHGRGCSGKGVT